MTSERGGSGPPRHDVAELYVHSRGAATKRARGDRRSLQRTGDDRKTKLTAVPVSEVFGATSLGATR